MKKMFYLLGIVVIIFALTNAADAALVNNADGTITDTHTNLMWLQDANSADAMNLWQAYTWTANLIYGGYEDWRLPTGEIDCIDDCSLFCTDHGADL